MIRNGEQGSGAGRPQFRRLLTVGVVLGVVVASLAVGGSLATGAAQEQPTPVDSCTTITEPGEYRLTQDISASDETVCIEIRSSDVTLDGNGHAVQGQFDANRALSTVTAPTATPTPAETVTTAASDDAVGATAQEQTTTPVNGTLAGESTPEPLNATTPMGVYVNGNGTEVREDVTVRNLRTTDWVFGVGYDNAAEGTVRNVTAAANFVGVAALNASDLDVTGITSNENLVGVHFTNVSDSELSRTDVREGVSAVTIHHSDDNDLSNLSISGQTYLGVGLIDSDDHRLSDSSIANVRGTLSFGVMNSTAIGIDGSSDFSVADTAARNNENWTFLAENGSVDAEAENFTVDGLSTSFGGRDFGIDTATADPLGLSSDAATTGLTVVKTSADAAVSLDANWADSSNETAEARLAG